MGVLTAVIEVLGILSIEFQSLGRVDGRSHQHRHGRRRAPKRVSIPRAG